MNLKKIIQILIIAMYAITGVLLFFKGWYQLSPVQNKWLGAIILAYAIFRVFRMRSNESE